MRFENLKNLFAVIGAFFAVMTVFFIVIGLGIGAGSGWRSPDVAVVGIEGIISDASDFRAQLKDIEDIDSIKAVIIRINSPGGAVGPTQEIYSEIKRLKKTRKVVASMGAVAASGGYYSAVATDKILANPGTITGSIGVLVEFINATELMNKVGVKGYVVKSGRYKDTGSPFRSMEEDERGLIQSVIDDVNSQFINAVAEGRNIKAEKVKEIADGRIFSGAQAKALGLVDELGDLTDAINKGAEMAGIKERPSVIYTEKRSFSLAGLVNGRLGAGLEDYVAGLISGMRIMYLTPNIHG
jgi:protease-4